MALSFILLALAVIFDGDGAPIDKVDLHTALLCGGLREASLRQAGAVEVHRDPADLLKALEPP